jgi:anti-sigma-K factor RskA
MNETDHERWSEDVAAYMLGALEPAEAAELERHAEGCERCQAEIRWLTPALDALPQGVERLQPPRVLRERIMSEVRMEAGPGEARGEAGAGGERAEAGGADREARPGLGGRISGWVRDLGSGPMGLRPVAGFAAAVLVVAAVAGFAIGGGLGSDEGTATSTIVAGEAPGITAKMVSEGDSGTLHLANVEQLPSDRVLEAWVQRDGEVEPVEALFVPNREGQASTELPDMDGVEVVMVTTEPSGGSSAPTGEPLISIPVQ